MTGQGRRRSCRTRIGRLLGALPALTLVATFSAPALAHHPQAPTGAGPQPLTASAAAAQGEAAPAAIDGCSGAPIAPDLSITGEFGKELEGSYVMLPVDVPEGTDAIRVKYCHDQPQLSNDLNKHTIDMGVYEARAADGEHWGEDEFRGWGGSSRKDVTISPEATIDPDPNPVATEKTTVGYRPGPVPPGEWAIELGVAAVGDETSLEDGVVQWRVEIDLIDDPSFADEPYEPVPYDEAPARSGPGWYAGDLHVHARHSAPNDATMRETFDFAFCPDPTLGARCDSPGAQPGAGLDFITLSDYVGDRAWGEIGAFQDDYPGKLVIRSAEVITYRGHTNNQASARFVEYRTGPIHEARVLGSGPERTIAPPDPASPARPARPPSAILDDVHAAGGWTQLNHVKTFPSEVPTFGNFCRGCSWDYSDEETDYSKVDAIEVATGPAGLQENPSPGPNPFTPLAIRFWEEGIDSGGTNANRIAAVGASDSHNAGRRNDPLTQSPIGQATTVVHADELSEQGIREGIQAGHTYVKVWGNDGPDVRLTATSGPGKRRAMIGDRVKASAATFDARVSNLDEARAARPGAYVLHVIRDGLPFRTVPIPPTGDELDFEFSSDGPGRYRLQVERTATGVASIETVSTPIWLEPAPPGHARGGGGRGG